MKPIVSSVAIFLLFVSASSNANASILYDNTGAGSSGSDSITDVGPLGDSFSTGATSAMLTDVKAVLAVSSPGTGTISVDLYSDSSTSPDSLLANIGTLSDQSLTSSFTIKDFSLGTPIALAANTRYWIVLSSSNGSTGIWSYSSDISGTGVENEYLYNNNGGVPGVFANNQGGEPYQMQISADTAAAPEPATIFMLGAGFLLIAGYPAVSLARRKSVECNSTT